MSYQLVDEFRIFGLQNYNLDEKLNPIEINIVHSPIVDSLLICSSVVKDKNVFFLMDLTTQEIL